MSKKKSCQPVLIFQTTDLGYYTKNTLNGKNHKLNPQQM